MASIVYSYRKLQQLNCNAAAAPVITPARLGLAGATLSLGLILASQAAPRLQVPVELLRSSSGGGGGEEDSRPSSASEATATAAAAAAESTTAPSSSSSSGWNLKVRCPFDFTDNKHTNNNANDDDAVKGLDRVSRHPGLWAFGLTALGNAFLQPTVPLAVWMTGPAAVAWLGGAHTDSRYRRGLGGTLEPRYACQTSLQQTRFLSRVSQMQSHNSKRVDRMA